MLRHATKVHVMSWCFTSRAMDLVKSEGSRKTCRARRYSF